MSKQASRRCRQLTASGSDKCRFHGGWSLRGSEHPGFKNGEATKYSRAVSVWITSLGKAAKMLERADTPEKEEVAIRFASMVLANKPAPG